MTKIIEYTYENEMKESFRDYAVSVIVGRALPDVRDGFKPVHRRVLYAMRDLGILPNTPYKKSARIVGETIGKYHPHGDVAVYETMVRMAQDFRSKLPLVDGHGNFGSIDGDPAAAMRYTESRLAPPSMELLQDLEKDVVDFRDNYDGTEREPVLLPAKFPQLLVNGSFGIAVGMRSNIPPHNINEVIDSFLHYLKKPKTSIEELLPIISAPDYPTGGTIINGEEIKEFYRTGEGRAVIRSKIEIEPISYGKTNIVITEIPYTLSGNKTKLVNDLTMMVVDKKLNEVVDVRDESSKDGIRIVLEVKKGVNIDKLLHKLYSKTKIQDSESYQFIAIVDGKPTTLSLLDYFHHYLEFQKDITTRKYQYLHDKGLLRKEILDGLIQAIGVIDVIVEAVRGSKSTTQMRKCLTAGVTDGINFKLKKDEKTAKGFSFTEKQAKAILEMRLQKLGGLEIDALNKEHEMLLKELKGYQSILSDTKALTKVIRTEHQQFKKGFGSNRNTKVDNIKLRKYVEEKRIEEMLILVDRFGYAKTMDDNKNKSEKNTLKSDYKYILEANSDDRLMAFTNYGNLYQIKLKDIPKGKLKDKGSTIQAISKLERGEFPIYVTTKSALEKETYLIVTNSGLAKHTDGKDLISVRGKIAATKMNKGDALLFAEPVSKNSEALIIQTQRGYVAQLKPNAFSKMNKTAKGNISISVGEDDVLERVYLLGKDEDKELSLNGQVVKTSSLPISRRGSKGKLIK